MEKPKIVAIVGPTASGKSFLALQLARRFKGEIISADSVQVYRGLTIGTAKPSLEQRRQIPHHLIDILGPDENYSAALFRQQADEIIRELHKKQIPIVVVGGTGLYLRALLEGIFPGVPVDEDTRRILQERLRTEGASKLHEELLICDRISAERIHENDSQRLLRALEVFGDVLKEYNDLATRTSKLQEEKASVLSVIDEVEKRKTEAFMKTYTEINNHFSNIYEKTNVKYR